MSLHIQSHWDLCKQMTNGKTRAYTLMHTDFPKSEFTETVSLELFQTIDQG